MRPTTIEIGLPEALRVKSAEFWLKLQNLYELRLAAAKNGKAIKKLSTLKHSAEA